MGELSPRKLVCKCYGHRTKDNRWYGMCLDLNIAVEADDPEKLKSKMLDAITGYVETVLDTDDKKSIPDLLTRKAPLSSWLKYCGISALWNIKKIPIPGNFIFKEALPFHLANHCC